MLEIQENIQFLKKFLKDNLPEDKYENLISEMENMAMNFNIKDSELIRVSYLQGVYDLIDMENLFI